MRHPFKISPMTRLSLVMDSELKRDNTGVLTGLKDKYTGRLSVAEQKRDAAFRSLFLIDAALAFLITGSNFTLPLLGVTTTGIPAVIEVATMLSAVALVFTVVAFIDCAAYDAIVRQFGNSQARPFSIDPDFINAAESHVSLTLKLLRTKLNIADHDFHEPGPVFKIYSGVVFGLIQVLFVLFPIVHGLLIVLSIMTTYQKSGLRVLSSLYFAIVIIVHILAVLIWVGAYKDFKFFVDFPDDNGDDSETAGSKESR